MQQSRNVAKSNFSENVFLRANSVPGGKLYTDTVTSHSTKNDTTKKVIVFRNSIIRGIRARDFNQHVKNSFPKFQVFLVCDSKEILHYVESTLLGYCFKNMNCFSWIKLTSVLIRLIYWYYNTPSLQLPSLPRHLCQISPWPTKTPLTSNLHHGLHRFLYYFPPHSTTRYNYWFYRTIRQAYQIYYQAICKSQYLIGQTRYPLKSL